MSFLSELRRRNVIRVGAAYAVVSWLLVQVAETVFPLFGFDETPARIVVIILAIGFLPALVLAWVFEFTPTGLQRDEDVDRGLAVNKRTAKTFDRVVIVVLVVAVAFFAFDKFVLSESREKEIAESARIAAFAEAVETYKRNKSIAVLPFVDMSPDGDQQYLGDGLAEELIDTLVTLDGLNVASRTSSFAVKQSEDNISAIGEKLGVTSVLEGSIRRDGDELRVTAQLIDAVNDRHLWSETFDRDFSDIFYLQEEIAEDVAAALSIALEVEGRNHLPGAGTDNIDAYDSYLAGKAWGRLAQPMLAQPYLEQAVEIDPGYAEGWVALGRSIASQSDDHPSEQGAAMQERGRSLFIHAIDLNPELASAWGSLSSLNRVLGDWTGAVEAARKAAELAPGDIRRQLASAGIFGALGHTREAIAVMQLQRQIAPLSYGGAQNLAEYYIQAERFDDARATLEISESRSPVVEPGVVKRRFFIALSEGDLDAAEEYLAHFAELRPANSPVVVGLLEEMGSPPEQVLGVLHRYFDQPDDMQGQWRVIIASIAAYHGDPEFAVRVLRDELSRSKFRLRRLWYPFFSDARRLDEFEDLIRDLGLEQFYREYSWPDYCRPLGDDDFECF